MKRDAEDPPMVVADPHVVYRDAVHTSPWNLAEGAHLPQRDDWSTFRYAVKDVVLGVATHRYDRAARRLEVRAYFAGEHPAYEAFEPTRILFLVLASQAWQTARRMEIRFDGGVPWDLRLYLERELGERLSGHREDLPHELALRLYLKLTDLPEALLESLGSIPPEHVCFHVHRGTWSARQVRSMWRRGVPLGWVFRRCPDPVRQSMAYMHLLLHLSALMLEEHALGRLCGREEGARAGATITPGPDDRGLKSSEPIYLSGPDMLTSVLLRAGNPFDLYPVLEGTAQRAMAAVAAKIAAEPDAPVVFAFPLDVLGTDSSESTLRECVDRAGAQSVVVGFTLLQLKSEAELHLSITAMQADELELRDAWTARYAE
ncbi:MAG TPA: hypothetical protein VF584_11700 [Longimicrobium sp.]|jgi:hypothetical protein